MALPVGQSLHLPRRGDGTLWTPDRLLEPYNLGVRPAALTTVQWAAEPQITSTVSVSSASELLSSIQVPGRRTIVQAGTYTVQLNFVGMSDRWLDLQPGAVINEDTGTGWYGLQVVNSNRIKITGSDRQAQLNCAFDIGFCQDVMVDGVSITPPATDLQNYVHDTTRVSMIGNDIRGNLFIFYGAGIYQGIIANNQIVAGASPDRATWRTVSLQDSIVVDNRLAQNGHTTDHILRLEADASNVWFARNQGECTLGGQGVEMSVEDPDTTIYPHYGVIWEDNRWYDPTGAFFTYPFGQTSDINGLVMSGERFYTNARTSGEAIFTNIQDWSITDSLYQTYVAPPAWSFN